MNTIFAWIKRVYASLLELIEFSVTALSDSAVTVALRVAPIVAPVPNSIGVFNLTYTGKNLIQALMFAASIEIMMFVMVDRCVSMLDGFLGGSKSHKRMMAITATITLLLWLIVTVLVYKLESAAGGNTIMAAMPTFSLFAAFALGVGKWDAAYKAHEAAEKAAKAESARLEAERLAIENERKLKLQEEERKAAQAEAERVKAIEDQERARRYEIEDEERKARLEAAAKRAQAQLEVERIKAEADAQAKLNRSQARSKTRSAGTENGTDLTVIPLEHGKENENGTKNGTDFGTGKEERERSILNHIKDKGFTSIDSIASDTGIPKTSVYRIIGKLVDTKEIYKIEGNGKATYELNGWH